MASGNDQAKTEFLPYALDSSTYSRQFYEQADGPLLPLIAFRLASQLKQSLAREEKEKEKHKEKEKKTRKKKKTHKEKENADKRRKNLVRKESL